VFFAGDGDRNAVDRVGIPEAGVRILQTGAFLVGIGVKKAELGVMK
jgi:hypothetical protein